MYLNEIIDVNIENIMVSNHFDCELIKNNIKNITIDFTVNKFINESNFNDLIEYILLCDIKESVNIDQEIIDNQEKLIELVNKNAVSYNIAGNLAYYITIATMLYIIYNRSKNAIEFVFYKMELDRLIKFFKHDEFFSSKATNKLLNYEYRFNECSDYGKYKTPFKILISESESFKLRHCFIRYTGSTFLFLMRQYKDYLKYKNIQVLGRLETPADLLNIRDERINVNIKNSLFNMNKIVNVFLDDMYKNRLNILFKLIISDNFDISRFEFDDFK